MNGLLHDFHNNNDIGKSITTNRREIEGVFAGTQSGKRMIRIARVSNATVSTVAFAHTPHGILRRAADRVPGKGCRIGGLSSLYYIRRRAGNHNRIVVFRNSRHGRCQKKQAQDQAPGNDIFKGGFHCN